MGNSVLARSHVVFVSLDHVPAFTLLSNLRESITTSPYQLNPHMRVPNGKHSHLISRASTVQLARRQLSGKIRQRMMKPQFKIMKGYSKIVEVDFVSMSFILKFIAIYFSWCYTFIPIQVLSSRLVYIGDSASLSFLQNIRRLIESASGPSSFTTDSIRHTILEAAIQPAPSNLIANMLPDIDSTQYLVNSFFQNVKYHAYVFSRT